MMATKVIVLTSNLPKLWYNAEKSVKNVTKEIVIATKLNVTKNGTVIESTEVMRRDGVTTEDTGNEFQEVELIFLL